MSGKHIHLEPLGGIAGDMFVAAMLDAFPLHRERVLADVFAVLPLAAGEARLTRVLKNGIGALHFSLDSPDEPASADGSVDSGIEAESSSQNKRPRYVPIAKSQLLSSPRHHHAHGNAAAGDYAGIKTLIESAKLSGSTATHALAILEIIARAESDIHCVPLENVHFHELAAWDSLMDVVAAGSLISAIGTASWSISALPLGQGQVRTQHGLLPVPAPATIRILEGYQWRSDNIAGERVTPTGAAIVRYLMPPKPSSAKPAGVLCANGYGAGSRNFAEMPNVLRVLVFDAATEETPARTAGTVAVIQFDVDDMSGEEIGIATERLRKTPGVLDLLLVPAQGKKGRPVTMFQLMTDLAQLESCCDSIFLETSTIGLRWCVTERRVLPRKERITHDGLRLKEVQRPDGKVTTKIESDELDSPAGLGERRRIKATAEGSP